MRAINKQLSQEGPKNVSFKKSLRMFPKSLLVTNCEENFRIVGELNQDHKKIKNK